MAFFSRVREVLKPKKGEGESKFNDLRRIPSVESLTGGSTTGSARETGVPIFMKSDSFFDVVDESKNNDSLARNNNALKKTPSFTQLLDSQRSQDVNEKENQSYDENNLYRNASSSSRTSTFEPVKDSRFASTRFAREPPSLKVKTVTDERTIFDDDDFFEPMPASPVSMTEYKASYSEDDYDYHRQKASPLESDDYSNSEVAQANNPELINVVFSKARHDRQEYVLELLEQGAFDVNSRDAHGNTLLHICAQNNNRKLAAKIIKRSPQVNINARNFKSMTPLDFAEKYGFVKLSEWLVTMGAVHGPLQRKLRQQPMQQERVNQFMSMR